MSGTSVRLTLIMVAAGLGIASLTMLPLQADAGIVNPTLTLDPVEDTNPVGTTHTVNATVGGSGFSGGLTILFNVTGANPSTGFCVTVGTLNASCTFSYVGVNAGHDDITATEAIFNLTAEADKDWIAEQRPVAGEIIDVDMNALIIAGVFANATWIVPVVGVVAGGILSIIITRRFGRRNQEL